MSKNVTDTDRPQLKIWRMRFSCRVPKATNTRSAYVLLIAFLLQQWLHESASVLHAHCLSFFPYTYVKISIPNLSKKKSNFEPATLCND